MLATRCQIHGGDQVLPGAPCSDAIFRHAAADKMCKAHDCGAWGSLRSCLGPPPGLNACQRGPGRYLGLAQHHAEKFSSRDQALLAARCQNANDQVFPGARRPTRPMCGDSRLLPGARRPTRAVCGEWAFAWGSPSDQTSVRGLGFCLGFAVRSRPMRGDWAFAWASPFDQTNVRGLGFCLGLAVRPDQCAGTGLLPGARRPTGPMCGD